MAKRVYTAVDTGGILAFAFLRVVLMKDDSVWDSYKQATDEALNEHRYAKASRIVKDGLEKATQLRRMQPDLVQRADVLARIYKDSGDYTSAASLYRMIVELQRSTLGPEHPDVQVAAKDLVSTLTESGCLNPARA